jgi:hypothetical protein
MSLCCSYFFQIPTDMPPTFWHTYTYLPRELLMLSRGASVPDLSERRKRARYGDRCFLPPRNAGYEEGPLRPRPPQWEVGMAGGSSRGRLSPVAMVGTRSGPAGAGSYPRVYKEGYE